MDELKYEFYIEQPEAIQAFEWMAEQNKLLAAKQAENPDFVKQHPEVLAGIPYTGAIGGLFTYSFTPTGLGIITTITNNTTKEKIDVSDYDSW